MTGLSTGDTSHLVAQRKVRMCGKKMSFRTRAAAEQQAEKFGQRVYECPVCFCWHCTSRETWRDDFVTVEEMAKTIQVMREQERRDRNREVGALNNQIGNMQAGHKQSKALQNVRIVELLKENADLKKRIRQLEAER